MSDAKKRSAGQNMQTAKTTEQSAQLLALGPSASSLRFFNEIRSPGLPRASTQYHPALLPVRHRQQRNNGNNGNKELLDILGRE
jgi:hypothetical protein